MTFLVRAVSLSALLALGALLAGGAGAASPLHSTSSVTVFAGSSMTSVLPAIDPGNTYSFGSTAALANQITNGAPADVLMGANTAACASLYAAGVTGKPINFTRNTLAVVVPKSNPAGITSIYDLTNDGTTIAVGAPSAPVGTYTVQVLNQMNLAAAIQPNVVTQETSDANVVAKVALGQVDAGFVYLSDYVIDPTHLTLIKVPAWAQPKITYSMCVVSRSSNQAGAQAWVNRVLSKAGQAVFVKDGFLPLTAPVPAIQKLAPARGAPGSTATILGSNLAATTSVTFRGIPARFKVVSATKLLVTVPARSKTGPITVTNPSGTATSPTFVVT